MKATKQIAAAEWVPPATIWNRMFFSIFLANMMLSLGQNMSNSLLSLYAKSMGAPADQIGMLMSMFAVTALIFRLVAGPAMNAYNRKKLVAMAMTFMATAYFGFSFAPVIGGAVGLETITVLKFFRLIQGIGNAFANSCCLTIVADVLPKDKFTSGMGIYACAQVIAQAAGPTAGVLLRDAFGYNKVYIIFGCLMICAILLSTQVKLAPRAPAKFSLKLNNVIAKEALVPAGVTFLVAIGFCSINAFMLVYAEERGIRNSSFFFTVYAVSMLVTRPLVGKLTDRYGFVKVGVPAMFATACSLAMIGISTNLPVLLLAAFINAFGYGAVQPALQSLCMKSVSAERRGSASSTNYIAQDAATLVGPTVCGYVASVAGYTPLMWLVMTVPIICGIAFTICMRNNIKHIEKSFNG